MKKRIMIVLGSPRKKGNSAKLAEFVAKGAREGGAKVETFYLNGMKIKPCQGCMKCQKENARGCAIRDDMHVLYPKLKKADALVIASPVYWFNLSAQTKTFIDRWFAVGVGERNIFKGKPVALVMSYGDTDPFRSGAVNALRSVQDTCGYLGAEIAGRVYGSAMEAGEIAKNKPLLKEAYQLGRRLAGPGA